MHRYESEHLLPQHMGRRSLSSQLALLQVELPVPRCQHSLNLQQRSLKSRCLDAQGRCFNDGFKQIFAYAGDSDIVCLIHDEHLLTLCHDSTPRKTLYLVAFHVMLQTRD